MTAQWKQGWQVTILRRPFPLEPGSYIWNEACMGNLIGQRGIITDISKIFTEIVGEKMTVLRIKVCDSEFYFPPYCIGDGVECQCDLRRLMLNGCNCGAFKQEKNG